VHLPEATLEWRRNGPEVGGRLLAFLVRLATSWPVRPTTVRVSSGDVEAYYPLPAYQWLLN